MLIDGIDYKIASKADDIKKAYELVYENYIEKEFCKLNIHKMRIFLFDSLPTTRTFIAKDNDEVLATATLVFDSPIGLPSEGIFKDRLDQLRKEKNKLCEISKLSTRRDLGIKAINILANLFRSCWLYARDINPHSHFCIMVEPQNEKFYLKTFFFENNTPLRLDPKANEAPSMLLEMELNITKRASINLNNKRNLKRYKMHFEDPMILKILKQQKITEENHTKINISLNTPRNRSTLALSSAEKDFLRFKFFIIRYNLEQINIFATNQSSRGSLHEATESYENLMKTLPTWAFRKEKDDIYEKLTVLFFHMSDYKKVYQISEKLRTSTNNSISIQGRNRQGLAQFFLKGKQPAIKILDEANILAREHNDKIVISRNLHFSAMILNNTGDHEKALKHINESIELIKDTSNISELLDLYLIEFRINLHLGKINGCKSTIQILQEEVRSSNKQNKIKQIFTYNACMANYYQLALQNKKAIYYFENILNNILKIDEEALNYSVSLSMASQSYLFLGNPKYALQIIHKRLDMKSIELIEDNTGPKICKLQILLFLDHQPSITELKREIRNNLKINNKSQPFFQQTLMLEKLLNGEFSQLLKMVKQSNINEIKNKPQLSNVIDKATAHLLNNKNKKAKSLLEMKSSLEEIELINSDIDNQFLIKIYTDLSDRSLKNLINDIEDFVLNQIDENEILVKAFILKNIIHIIDIQNSKKSDKSYLEINHELMNIFSKVINGKDIPIFNKFLSDKSSC
ncbi:MAG: hypothetical protein COA79_10680 [Planctomycetota bacterium]|nr:MAG: hypothetical protein COA79_10680 [Planctomycetota bacterium]